MSQGTTLARMLGTDGDGGKRIISPNVLINPSFTHIRWGQETSDHATLLGWSPKWLIASPGWFPYGATSGAGADGSIDFAPLALSPYFPNAANVVHGVSIVATQNKVFGLVQQIPVGETLRGRKVRISGMYRPAAGQEAIAGISIWLKSGRSTDTIAAGDWNAGGRGYDTADLAADVMHPLAMTVSGGDYNTSHQCLVRCFDEISDTGAQRQLKLNAPSTDGVAFYDELTLHYLDDGLSGTPATDGSYELYSEADGAASDHYFEQVVDIPDNADLFSESECWLIILPVHPTDVASMTQNADINLYFLSMEVVLEDATAADRVLAGLLGTSLYSLPVGLGEGGVRSRYLMHNPIYVPEIYPLKLFNLEHRYPLSASTTAELELNEFEPGGGGAQQLRISVSDEHTSVYASQDLPWGCSVLRAAFSMTRNTGAGTLTATKMRQVLGYETAAADKYAVGRTQYLIEWADASATAFYESGAYRNRIGDYWPDQPTLTDPVDLSLGTNGTAEVIFQTQVSGANTLFYLNGGYILVLVDPRTRGGYFQRKP